MVAMTYSDYANWIQRIWQKQVEFPDLVTYASQPDFSPSLAAVLYQTWLKRNPSPFNAFAWFNLGVLLFSEKDFAGAQAAYESALSIKPDLVSARFNLGLVFERLGKAEEAIEQWKTVEETAKPEISDEFAVLISALNSTGRLQETLKQYQPACAALEKSLLLKPAQKDVIHHLIFMRQKQCQWPIYAPVGDTDEDTLRNGTSALAMLNVSDDPATQLEAALSYSQAKIPDNLPSLAPTHGYRHDKIRIAYCSGDFCTHPVAMLMVELLEEHDREKFEIYAFCWSPNDGSGLRQRVIQGVDHYIPIHELSEADSARLIREHEIDILVDLHGQTNNTRIQMLAPRPAPIQITYLGLPATTGLPCIDYVIADRFLIPEEHAGCYSEKPLYMPDVYQVSDRKRAIGKTPARADCGLPDDKFVFCSFNNNHKYTLEMFTVWMNILRQVPDSVLWLLADNPWSKANLLKQAEAQGIDPNRLFFAERALPADYLARYRVADLFLDTFPFNAGTTANDALWMELPVLTLCGRSFAARMAGALLTAAGLPELITYDLKTYESKAIKLAKDARALKRLRKKLADAKTKSPLFNTTQFARNLEAHYIELVTAFDQQAATTRPARQVAPASKPLQKTKQLIEIATEAEQFQAQGDIASAIQTYRQWIKQSRSQDKWVAWFNLGVLLNNSGDLTGAEQAFQAVLELQPSFAPAKVALERVITTTSDQTIHQVSGMHSTPPLSSSRNMQLFTIAWSSETCIQTDPNITILDNTANPRPDWREYWPIRHFLKNNELEENTLYGFLSPKFFAKTGLSGGTVIRFIREHSNDVDVFTFSPQADMSAFFLNVFEQGEIFDPGFMDTCQALAQEIGIAADLHTLIMDSRQVVFSNFIVARPAFWRHWLAVCEKIFQIAETDDSLLAKQINIPTTYPGQVTRKVFIIERIASLLLAIGQWRSQPYSTFRCAWSALPTSQFRTEAVISDALKLAYNKTQDGEYKKAYAEIRKQIFENKQAEQV